MRSIPYLTLGIPTTLDDCLDLSEDELPLSVSYELKTTPLLAEWILLSIHKAVFTWQFVSRPGTVIEHILAVYPQACDAETRYRHLTEANFRLERILTQLQEFGVPATLVPSRHCQANAPELEPSCSLCKTRSPWEEVMEFPPA